ncbi:hypothetical protein VTK56DRAFT_2873 [Thermocarpiscus australiensis]
MCIKVTRHFRCGDAVEHVCEYLARCSNPIDWSDDVANGISDYACMEELDSREEWYAEPCPGCTGEMAHPKSEPVRVETRRSADNTIGGRPYAAEEYARNLAHWLFAYIHALGSRFREHDPFWDRERRCWAEGGALIKERLPCLLLELICPFRREHGSPWRLEELEDGRLRFARDRQCDCVATRQPGLCNTTWEIRQRTACKMYRAALDARSGPLDLDDRRACLWLVKQDDMMAKQALLQKKVLDKGVSLLGRLPLLETLRPQPEEIAERTTVLTEHNLMMVALFRQDIVGLGPEDRARFSARESLLAWVRFILARDSGLSLERADTILIAFAARLLRHDPNWQAYQPKVMDWKHDDNIFKRLALTANKFPRDMLQWVVGTLGPARFSYDSMRCLERWSMWALGDRTRAGIVAHNVVEAREHDLEELGRRGEAVCAICLESFDEHHGGGGMYRMPVQNWRCALLQRRHWFGRACLVRFARALPDGTDFSSAPTPHCPICREPFMDFDVPVEDGDEESDEDGFDGETEVEDGGNGDEDEEGEGLGHEEESEEESEEGNEGSDVNMESEDDAEAYQYTW